MHTTRIEMHLRTLILPVLAALVVQGCGSQPGTPAATASTPGVERTVKEVTIASGTPVTMADLSIEGMSCEMMCGGSIRKALAKLPGVTLAEIRFNEEETRDHAIVTYDDSKVSDAQMIETIHGLHGGQYKVLAVEITRQVKGDGEGQGSRRRAEEEKGVNVYAPSSYVLPSLLALLTQIMRL
jgi:copper chaperone CopZ